MWAAAQLNLTLIEHLLAAGASINTQDDAGQNALHYAASPFADAMFGDVRKCVKLLMDTGASMSTTRNAQHSSDATLRKSALDLVVSSDHAALDPRVFYKWGADIHHTCISSFLDPLPVTEEKFELAQHALLHALSHHVCPAESIEVLCKHAVQPGRKGILDLGGWCMDKALNCALETRATESVISVLLDHGASANNEYNQLPLIAAITSGATAALVSTLLQHGADPNVRQSSEPKLTALEYARKKYRRDLVDLFESKSRQSYHTRRDSVEPAAQKLSGRGSRDSRMFDVNVMNYLPDMNKLEDLAEVDEQDDSDDYHDCMEMPEVHYVNEAQGSRRSSRPWLPGRPQKLVDGR
jgi:hypothetical protein